MDANDDDRADQNTMKSLADASAPARQTNPSNSRDESSKLG
jgi:hypothetical protein